MGVEYKIQADAGDEEDVPLDLASSLMAGLTVSFALRFEFKAEPQALAGAFGMILPSFKVLGGRLAATPAGMVVRCGKTCVADLIHEVREGLAPNFEGPIPTDLFDLAVECAPQGDELGKAPLRLRVTDFDDCQIIAISLCHALCDAAGIGAFLSAWTEAYAGGSGKRDITFDRSQIPPMPFPPGSPPLSAEEAPDEFRQLHHTADQQPDMPKGPLEKPSFVSARRSPADIARLKQKCKAMWEEAEGKELTAHLSSNDVLCAELISCRGIEGEVFAMNMIMEYRALVGASAVFGNMWTYLEFATKNSLAAAGDIRMALPAAMSKDFVVWHIGQGMNVTKPWPGKLFMNSWVKAIKLSEVKFASTASDIMLGLPMLQQRATGVVPMGAAYCVTLPQCDGGVKVVGVMPEAMGQGLAANDGGGVSIAPA